MYVGKRKGEASPEIDRLVEAVYQDAVRTDPNHPFYSKDAEGTTESLSPDSISNVHGQSNVQKLVNIITIYILEHEEVSYTQGMTDLLSPILYIMGREADAYICFAAMVERIKGHFNMWCDGTLLKIERLRHICLVLDPELFHFLTNKIEEDAFALFFGMVLIECRREFSFDDSFQLLESIWAGVTCMKGAPPQQSSSTSNWAKFMTNKCEEVVQQVFGETQTPYSAKRLPRSSSDSITYIATNQSASSARDHSLESADEHYPVGLNESNDLYSVASTIQTIDDSSVFRSNIYQRVVTVDIEDSQAFRPRSHTDPSIATTGDNGIKNSCAANSQLDASPSHVSFHSHSESELYDSFPPNEQVAGTPSKSKIPTEMADLSSVSSDATSTRDNFPSILGSNQTNATSPVSQMSSFDSIDRIDVHKSLPNHFLGVHQQVANDDNTSGEDSGSDCSPNVRRVSRQGERITIVGETQESNTSTLNRLCRASSRNQSPAATNDSSSLVSNFDIQRSRITPVSFFDAIDTIASSALEKKSVDPGQSGACEVSLIVSQITEQRSPRITRENSLSIPVSDCFSLFVCMSILSQHRYQIMHSSTDFVGLSVILNTQAGRQDINKTLYVARDLYQVYRSYQVDLFGDNKQSLNTWLDDDRDDNGFDEG